MEPGTGSENKNIDTCMHLLIDTHPHLQKHTPVYTCQPVHAVRVGTELPPLHHESLFATILRKSAFPRHHEGHDSLASVIALHPSSSLLSAAAFASA